MILGTVLHVPPGSPWILHAGAALLLGLHIGGGLVGIASGTAALLLRKGGRAHRLAGNVFVVSMLVMSGVGAAVSPFIHQPANIFGGVFAFYLTATGWAAVRRRAGAIGRFEVGAMLVPVTVVVAMLIVGMAMVRSPTHSLDGVPAPAPFVLAGLAALAAGADLSVILRKGLKGSQRIARHLWRLCAALLIADGSLFLGQPKVFPHALRGSPIMFLPELFVAATMIFWLVRLGLRRVPGSGGVRRKPTARLGSDPSPVRGIA